MEQHSVAQWYVLSPPLTFGFESEKREAQDLFTKPLTQLLNSNYC